MITTTTTTTTTYETTVSFTSTTTTTTSTSTTTSTIVSTTVLPDEYWSDINDDGYMNLKDAILSLQIVNQMQPDFVLNQKSDISGDDKIGLEETIYIMQFISNIR